MVGIVFLPSISDGAALTEVLSRLDEFDNVYHVGSQQGYRARLQDNPAAICFLPRLLQAPCASPQYWVAVGKTDADAIAAFSLSAHGFIHLPIRRQQIKQVVGQVYHQQQLAQQRAKLNTLIAGVCQQYGLSRQALIATLRRRHALYKAPVFVTVNAQDGICRVAPQDILWIEAQGDYMQIHLLRQRLLVRSTLFVLLQQLGSQRYLRCNRSIAVNIHQVASIDKVAGQLNVLLNSGKRIKISPRYQNCGWQLLYVEQAAENPCHYRQ